MSTGMKARTFTYSARPSFPGIIGTVSASYPLAVLE